MKMKDFKVFSFLLFFTLFHLQYTSAQQQQDLLFKNYSVENGLVSNTIWAIEQDKQGYLWFGTRNGLSRFDGYEFKSYQFSSRLPHSLGNNFIHSLFTYDEDHLWIGTSQGIYVLDLKTERFSYLDKLGNLTVNDFQQDANGNLWIATGRGLYFFNRSNGSLTKQTLEIENLKKIALDKEGNIWLATIGRGIVRYNPVTKKSKNFFGEKDGIMNDFMLTIYADKSGRIWAGSFGGGLSLWMPEENKFKYYLERNSGISSDIVRSLLQIKEGTLLVGTEKGLNILDISKENFTNYVHNPSDIYSLSGNAIYSLYQDENQGVWLGSYFGGVSYYSTQASGFQLYYPGVGKYRVSGGGVSAILQDEPNKYWIGTEDAGLNYFDANTNTFKRYPFQNNQDSLSYFNILALEKVKDEIWIGTFSGGLNIYNKTTGKVKVYNNKKNNLNHISGNNVHCIYKDKDGIVWVGTSHGLNIYNVKTNKFTQVQELGNRFITDIYEDDTGVIWFAANGGVLFGKRKKSEEWVRYNFRKKLGFSGVGRFSILDDHEGNLWLATEGNGLVKFNFRDKKFELYGKKHNIDANVVYDIVQEDDRTLWLSTNNGIYHLDPHNNSSVHFTKWDGLQSNEFNYNAGYIASDGKIFFGGINGFNSFYPDSVTIKPLDGNIVINEFQLFNENVSLSTPNQKILSKTINYTDHIKLSHKQSVISFEYAAINFRNPKKTKYAYKMQGFDERWNYVGTQRKATYTNLPPGDYEFLVKATNNNKNWKGQSAKLGITVAPPFYLHPLAYLIYAVLSFFSILFFRKQILERAERRNEIRLQKLSVEQEKQFYNQKIEFFTTMAHEIRTPLSLITAPLDKLMSLSSLPASAYRQLEIMDKNSKRLLNLVSQLLDFRRIESDIYTIHKERLDLVVLIQSLYSRFSAMKYQKDVRFTLITKVSNLEMLADPEALTKIFNNILINAFKFTKNEVNITIHEPVSGRDGKEYSLTVITDDGIGIPKDELENIFKKYFKVGGDSSSSNLIGTGIGLSLAKSLIEKHDGYLEVNSIPDFKTEFKIYLPFKNNISIEDNLEDNLEENNQVFNETSKETILVIEDDEYLLDFFCENLSQSGYRVFRSKDGEKAWQILNDHEIELVLSDVMMPGINGLELCKKIKSSPDFSHIPVILLTAKTNSHSEIKGIQYGADAYISKPFKWEHVIAVIENRLKSRAELKEKFANHPFISVDSLTENIGEKKLLEKITKVIEERITDPKLSVKELSKEMGMSRSNLHKKLKAISGKVPNEFIRLVRLKHAAKLLVRKEYTISEVSYMSGFNTHSYFSKCFYNQFKITPSEFVGKATIEGESFDNDLEKN